MAVELADSRVSKMAAEMVGKLVVWMDGCSAGSMVESLVGKMAASRASSLAVSMEISQAAC